MGRNHFPYLNRICQLFVLAILFAWAATYSMPAHAQTYEVIHNFGNGTDGAAPSGAIYTDSAGNIFGATLRGGTLNAGVIYKIDQNNNDTILHDFDHVRFGSPPSAGLAFFNGTWLFGITASGGDNQDGSVFAQQLSPPAFKNVRSFNGSDGQVPVGTLVLSADGSSAYGVTSGGGAHDAGEVYKIGKSGEVTVIYSFTGGSDGGSPSAGLLLDSAGNLYGVASAGGTGFYGVLFRIDPSGKEQVVHNFDEYSSQPDSALVADGTGNVYGTSAPIRNGNYGVVYRVNLSTGIYTPMHQLVGDQGRTPVGNLAKDGRGHL